MILNNKSFFKKHYVELIFQVVVHLVLFLFYSFSQDRTSNIEVYKISFFLNYAAASIVINYVLIPKLFSKKKFWQFFILFTILIVLVILFDEFVLEQIYFPDTRGKYFPGILFTLGETLPIIFLFLGFKFAWDYNRKQSEIDVLKNLVQESELQFLKSQIDPHFLFNNLNNLYAHAIEESPKTPKIILELSSVLRYILYDCQENYVSLPKEITHLKNYTALNELQIGERGKIIFNVGEINTEYNIAPLILMVFIENAFKHSPSTQYKDIFITIKISILENNTLKFICENNFSKTLNTNKSSKGIGLENVKKRLALLYPNTHNLSIIDDNNIFIVKLLLELTPTK